MMRTAFFAFSLFLLAASPTPAGAVEAQIQVADLVPFTLRDDPQAKMSLLVYGGSPLVGLRAAVKELKDPDGQSLPPTLLDVSVESPQVAEQGTHVYLRPDLSGFRRPGEYLAVVLLTASPPVPVAVGVGAPRPLPPPPSRLITVTLRRERPTLHAEPLHVRVQRPTPWQAARVSVPYSVENRGPRELHELSLHTQPLVAAPEHGTRGEGRAERPREAATTPVGSLTVVMPPPPPGQTLQRQRTGQGLDLGPSSRLDFTLLFSDLRSVGRFRGGLALRSPEIDTPQILPMTVEVVDRWEFAWLAIAIGVLLSALVNQLSRRYRNAAENHYRIAQLALELEGLRPTGSVGSSMRASFAEQLRRAALRNSDGEATLCARLLDEIDAELTNFYGTQNELRCRVLERLDRTQTQSRQLGSHRASMNPDQVARLRQIRSELERVAAFVATEQFEIAEQTLSVVQDQVQSLIRALSTPDPNAPTLHDGVPSLLEPPGLRIEVHEPASRFWAGSAVRLRVIDERRERKPAELPVYIWRLGDGAAEPGAAEIEFPLDKPGLIEVSATVRHADGSEAGSARRQLQVMAPRPEIDLDAAPGPRLRVQYVLTLISLVLASLSGVYFLCFGTALQPLLGSAFGAPVHYIAAVAWGLAVDLGLRGFSDLLLRLSADR